MKISTPSKPVALEEREDECTVCHKVDLVKNLLPDGEYDSICKECAKQQGKLWREFEDRMGRLEPILNILRTSWYSKEDLKQLMLCIETREWDY